MFDISNSLRFLKTHAHSVVGSGGFNGRLHRDAYQCRKRGNYGSPCLYFVGVGCICVPCIFVLFVCFVCMRLNVDVYVSVCVLYTSVFVYACLCETVCVPVLAMCLVIELILKIYPCNILHYTAILPYNFYHVGKQLESW